MARITGEGLFSLIRGLNDISEEMERIIAMSEFRVTNEYSISGYRVQDIKEHCEKAEKLISQAVYETVR